MIPNHIRQCKFKTITCSFFEGLTLRVIGDVAFGMDLSDPEAETSRQFYKEANTVVHIEKLITPYTMFWILFAGKFPDTFYTVAWHGLEVNGEIYIYRPISQIPRCIKQISHNAPLCNTREHVCCKMVHCGIWEWCIMGFVRQVYWILIRILISKCIGFLSVLYLSFSNMVAWGQFFNYKTFHSCFEFFLWFGEGWFYQYSETCL